MKIVPFITINPIFLRDILRNLCFSAFRSCHARREVSMRGEPVRADAVFDFDRDAVWEWQGGFHGV